MLNKDTKIKVLNRSHGSVCYEIPDLGIRRDYAHNETKTVTFEELEKLSYIAGGEYLLREYLVMDNKEAIEALLGDVEPEYFYSEAEVTKLLNYGSLDQLDDCLSFGQEGIVDLVKDIAFKTKLNDVAKRKLILDKTGFDITAAIELTKDDGEEVKEETPKRKANPITATAPTGRKAAPPKYNITSMK